MRKNNRMFILLGLITLTTLAIIFLTDSGKFYAKKWYHSMFSDQKTTGWKTELIKHDDGYTLVLTSRDFEIDTIYRSMTGPAEIHYLTLLQQPKRELLWLTEYEIEVISKDSSKYDLDDFMCHNNLDIGLQQHNEKFGISDRSTWQSPRLATLTQGQTSVKFPKGFALPVWSDDNLAVAAQVLNLNLPELNTSVKHQMKFHFKKDVELTKKPKPLFQQSISVLAKITPEYGKHQSKQPLVADCRPAIATTNFVTTDQHGDQYTGHWILNEGVDIKRYNVTNMLNLKYDTKIHHIGVHAHAYTNYIALKDLTTDSIIYHSNANTFNTKNGLQHIDYFSSNEGAPLYKDHDYEIICETNNTSGKVQDMMAVMLLYLYDKELDEKLSL